MIVEGGDIYGDGVNVAARLGQGKLSLDIGLWDAKTYQLAWNAITDSYEMDAGAEGAKNLADFMVATMVERGFVAP